MCASTRNISVARIAQDPGGESSDSKTSDHSQKKHFHHYEN
jgi:hypothetical protein